MDISIKKIGCVIMMVTTLIISYGQSENIDSLVNRLEKQDNDTARVDLLNKLAFQIYPSAPLVAENYAKEAATLSRTLYYQKGLSRAYKTLGITYGVTNNYPVSLDYLFRSLKIDEALDDKPNIAKCFHNIAIVYFYTHQHDKGYEAINKAIAIDYELGDIKEVTKNDLTLILYLIEDKKYNEAEFCCQKVINIFASLHDTRGEAVAYSYLARIHTATKKYSYALSVYALANSLLQKDNNQINITYNCISMAKIHIALKQYDSSAVYINKALQLSRKLNSKSQQADALEVLSNLYLAQNKHAKALQIFKRTTALRDETFNLEKSKQISELNTIYGIENKEKEIELNNATINKQSIVIIAITVIMSLLLVLVLVAWYFYRSKQKANKELKLLYTKIKEQNEEIHAQSEELQQANEEIISINQNLENILQERSKKILRQNRQLKEYAFTNSHKVRGPVARLMGLFNLIKINNQLEDKEYLRMMETTIHELDTIIRELTEKLHASENENN